MTEELLWPRFASPGDLATIESIPLAQRGLPRSTYEILKRAATLWPDRPAVRVLPDAARWDEPVSQTFAELLAEVTRAANLLADLGVARTSTVAVISPNCDELIIATLAAQAAGIAVPINGALSTGHVMQLIERAGAKVVIAADPDLDERSWNTTKTLVEAGAIDTVLLLRPTGTRSRRPAPTLDGVLIGYFDDIAEKYDSTTFHGTAAREEDLAALFHTGGTTGLPKLAAHTHANEVADAWMVAAITMLDQDSVIFAGLPLFHVNALVVTLLAPLLRGQQTVWAGPLGYREAELLRNFWKIVERYRLSAMSAVPTVYAALTGVPVDSDISSLRFALVGASALPASVRATFELHTNVPLVEGYGLTEATCASARSFPDHPRRGSVGQRLPYQHVKTELVDADGRMHDAKPGEPGVLAISGPTIFPGYVIGHDEGALLLDGGGKLTDGWLDTGDLAWVDDQGFIYLTGRAKDLIIRGGHNIDPVIIEDALMAHPEVIGAAAVGRPDIHAGEVPVAYVTVAPDSAITEKQLEAWAAEHVGERAAVPKSVTILEALPLTAIGKPFKLPLRADAAKAALSEALTDVAGIQRIEASAADGTVRASVSLLRTADAGAVRSILDHYTVSYDVDFADAGSA